MKSLGTVKVDTEFLEIRSKASESVSVLRQVVEQLVAAVKSQSHMALIHCNCYNGKKSLENRKKDEWMSEEPDSYFDKCDKGCSEKQNSLICRVW